MLAQQDLLAGRYRYVRELGQGALGRVFLATDTKANDAPRAIKAVSAHDATWLAAEFAALSTVTHPNIAKVFELLGGDQHAVPFLSLPKGGAWLVEEFVESTTADRAAIEWSHDRGELTRDIAHLACIVASALATVHARGLVHGDVKPANILVPNQTDGGVASLRLVDFGLSRPMGVSRSVRGTPDFLAPEAWLGECSAATDLYALGVTLVHLLQQRAPTDSQSSPRAASPVEHECTIPEWVDPRFQRVLALLLAKDQAKRASSAREVSLSLQSVAQLLGAPRTSTHVLVGGESVEEKAARMLVLPRVGNEDAVHELVDALASSSVVWVRGARGSGRSRVVRDAVRRVQEESRQATRVVPTYAISGRLPAQTPTYPTLLHLDQSPTLSEAQAFVDACAVASVDVHLIIETEDEHAGAREVRVDALSSIELKRFFTTAFGEKVKPSDAWLRDASEHSNAFAGTLCLTLHRAMLDGLDPTNPDALRAPRSAAQLEAGTERFSADQRELLQSIALAGAVLSPNHAAPWLGDKARRAQRELLASGRLEVNRDGDLVMGRELRDTVLRELKERDRTVLLRHLSPLAVSARAAAYLLAHRHEEVRAIASFHEEVVRLRDQERFEEAYELALDAFHFFPKEDGPRFVLADLARARGHYAEATSLLAACTSGAGLVLKCEVARLRGDTGLVSTWLSRIDKKDDAAFELRALKARVMLDQGKVREASALAEEVLRGNASQFAVVRATEVLSLTALRDGELNVAQRRADDMLQRAQASGIRALEARASSLISSLLMQLGQARSAMRYAEAAATLAKSTGEVHATAVYEVNFGLCLLDQGELGPALSILREGAQKLIRIGRDPELSRALYNAANAAALAANESVALTLIARAEEVAAKVGDEVLSLYATLVSSDVHTHSLRWDAALEALRFKDTKKLPVHVLLPWAARVAWLSSRSGGRAFDESIAGLVASNDVSSMSASARVDVLIINAARARAVGSVNDALTHLLSARELALELPFEQRLRLSLAGAELAESVKDRAAERLFLSEARSLLDHAAATLDEHGRALLRSSRAYQRALASKPSVESAPSTTSDRPDRWRALAGLAKELAKERPREDLEDEVLRAALSLSGAARAFLIEADSSMQLVVRATREVGVAKSSNAEFSHSLVARVILAEQGEASMDALTDTRFVASKSAHTLLLRSVAAVPIRFSDESTGVLYVDDRLRPSAFDRETLDLLSDLAELASLAFESASRRRQERLARRKLSLAHERLQRVVSEQGIELSSLRAAREEGEGSAHPGIVAHSEGMRLALSLAERVASSDVPVLITGESGTGKELVARAIHAHSERARRAFVAENCGAIPEPLLESALFGHVRGAFTGADRIRSGLFEVADGGTLLLDEIAELSPGMQVKFLRVLQTGEVRAVGSDRPRHVDVRIVAATHRDVDAMVRDGRFREDLYYRLAVVTIRVPPLRERVEDVAPLVAHFLERDAKGRKLRIDANALALLQQYKWPGNVRQLENEMKRALVLCRDVIRAEHLSDAVRGRTTSLANTALDLRAQTDALEKRMIREALEECGNNQSRAAKMLGVSRFGLQKMMKRLGLSV